MILKKCILTQNACYTANKKMTNNKPTGIVVHSTGANNKNLKRYVQPLKTDKDYSTIINDLGVNSNGNHWNAKYPEGGRKVCVHAFIGINANGVIETYQTLPFDVCCWGVGSGKKGSYNYNPQARIQFEICEDNLKDEKYFNMVFKEAIEFCAYLCKTYGFGVDKISSHHESYLEGYGGNHSDCDHWLKKFGKDMDWFRAEVKKQLNASTTTTTNKPTVTVKPTTSTTKPTSSATYKAGTKVTLSSTPVYASSTSTSASAKKSGTYYLWSKDVVNGRIRITNSSIKVGKTGQVTGWIKTSDIKTSSIANTIEVGDTVKIKSGAKTYTGGKLSSFVYSRNYKVKEKKGDRVVVTFAGIVIAAVKLSDLTLVKKK